MEIQHKAYSQLVEVTQECRVLECRDFPKSGQFSTSQKRKKSDLTHHHMQIRQPVTMSSEDSYSQPKRCWQPAIFLSTLPALLKKCLLRYYVTTGSFLASFAQEIFVTLLRYYGVFPCRLCSRNACYVITLLRGLSLPALLKKCLLRYYVITGSFLAGFTQEMFVTLLRYYNHLSLPALLKNRL